jgi:5,6-dimethylbenzimidazole synthase
MSMTGYEDLLSIVKERRSCRRFKPDPIPDEYVNKIIDVARWAPSGANSQPWDFIVVKKNDLRKKISQYIKDFISIYYKLEHTREPALRFPSLTRPVEKSGYEDAPIFIILCGDKRTKEAYPRYTAVEMSEGILESSLASAFLYMQLAAGSLGLGSQWVTAVRMWYVQCLIRDLLGIPDEFVIYDMFVVGYPASKPKPRVARPIEEMVHEDYYNKDKFRSNAEIKDFISTLRTGRTYSEMGSRRSSQTES